MTWYNQSKRKTSKEEIQEPNSLSLGGASGDGGLVIAHGRVVLMGSRKPCKQCS